MRIAPRIAFALAAGAFALAAVACGSLQAPAGTPNAVRADVSPDAARVPATDATRVAVKLATIEAQGRQQARPGLATPVPVTALPDSNDPRSCGQWSREGTGDVSEAITAEWGEVIGCLFSDDQWVISAIPAAAYPGRTGVIAVYACRPNDATCEDGRKPHPIDKWQFFPPPSGIGTKIWFVLSPTTLYLGAKECFDLDTHIYETCPASLLAQLG